MARILENVGTRAGAIMLHTPHIERVRPPAVVEQREGVEHIGEIRHGQQAKNERARRCQAEERRDPVPREVIEKHAEYRQRRNVFRALVAHALDQPLGDAQSLGIHMRDSAPVNIDALLEPREGAGEEAVGELAHFFASVPNTHLAQAHGAHAGARTAARRRGGVARPSVSHGVAEVLLHLLHHGIERRPFRVRASTYRHLHIRDTPPAPNQAER